MRTWILVAVLAAGLLCLPREVVAQAALGGDLDADGDRRITEAELAEYLANHRDTDWTSEIPRRLLERCDTAPRDAVLEGERERQCLAAQPLDAGFRPAIADLRHRQPQGSWRQNIALVFTSPIDVTMPSSVADSAGRLFFWAVMTALLAVLAGSTTDRAIRMAGWSLTRWTRGAWFRMPRPVHLAIGLGVGTLVGVMFLFAMIATGDWWPARRQPAGSWFVPVPRLPRVELEWLLACLAPVFAFTRAHQMGYLADRTRLIERAGGGAAPAAAPHGHAHGRPLRIVICCDGTGNQADAMEEGRRSVSNVRKFYERLLSATAAGWDQYAWYDAGVGTGTSRPTTRLRFAGSLLALIGAAIPARVLNYLHKLRMVVELGFGVGITENIADGYRQIVERYRPGDQIVLIGFSRGAYTARCIAGVISRAGLLRAEHAVFVDDVVRLYRYRHHPKAPIEVWPQLMHQDVTVDFLGLWDTVSSLGVPLWGWTFSIGGLWSNRALDTSPARACRIVRHALSIDEERSQFMPTLFTERPPQKQQDVKQLWFRGSHAGVGGGYPDAETSDVSLQWMIDEASKIGLQFVTDPPLRGSSLGDVRTELARQPFWQISGYWPRWHPCDVFDPQSGTYPPTGFGALHPTVVQRARHAASFRAPDSAVTADELHVVRAGTPAYVSVRADLAWNRTGVILERGKSYRIRYVGGEWRDSEHRPCGPYGEDAVRWTDLRRFGGWRRRVTDGRWMELILHLAHPRRWPLHELPGRKLIALLIVRTPLRLHRTLMRAGRELAAPGATVDVVIQSQSGILYGFANDWWMFHQNNTGSVTLEIVEVAQPAPQHFVVRENGRVEWVSAAPATV